MAKKQEGTFKRQLIVRDLLAKHKDYQENKAEWDLLLAVYEGIKQIKKMGYIKRHEREPEESYRRRMEELYGLGYSKSIIDIFHFYLFKKPPKRELKSLNNDEAWQLFLKDANLFGDSFDTTIMDIALYSAIEGHMGILVDRPNTIELTRKQQIDNGIYPYIARYFPSAIYDWEMGKDEFGKPVLKMIKLLDDNGQFRIWFTDSWEVWELPKKEDGSPDISNTEAEAIFIESGPNPIGIVPFVWHYNIKGKNMGVGVSDISEISRIDLSIIRNLSQIEEVINYAAFPMLLKPKMAADPKKTNVSQTEDEVSVQAVQEFDPEYPNSIPQWMETEVADPIRAIIEFIVKKIEEIYRASNAGGTSTTEASTQAKSGVALKTEFQLLNSKLVSKAIQLEKTENSVIGLWLKWEEKEKLMKDIKIARERQFDIDNLANDLENAVVAKTVVLSATFSALLQKQVARTALPTASEKDMAAIDSEIEGANNEPVNPNDLQNEIDLNKEAAAKAGNLTGEV